MSNIKKIGLIGRFYKNYVLASSIITICSISIFAQYGTTTFSTLFWFKIATLGLIYYFINSYKQKEFYYYHNLGLSKTQLWVTTLGFDFILFIVSLIIAYKLR